MNNILNLPPLEYLRSFVVFADSPNIVVAAQALKISQPLLSKQLSAFEDAIGSPLFEFVGRKKVLTSLGRSIHTLLKSQLSGLGAEIHQIQAMQNQSKALRIGGRKEILEVFVLNLHYEGSLSFIALGSDEVERQLSEKKIDIGISQKEINSDRLVRKKLWSDEFVLCWNVGIKGVDLKDFRKALEILLSYRSYTYSENSILKNLLESAEVRLMAPQTTFSDWRVLMEVLRKEKSWSVMPIGYAQKNPNVRFMKLPVEFSHHSQFYVYYQKEFSRLSWFKLFIDKLVNNN